MNYKSILAAFVLILVGIIMLVLVAAIPVEASYREGPGAYPDPYIYDPYPDPGNPSPGAYPIPTVYVYDPYPDPIEEPVTLANMVSAVEKYFAYTYFHRNRINIQPPQSR